MESYIVRIYRRDEKDPAKIAGLVEIVQTGKVVKFAHVDELCGRICKVARRGRRGPKRQTEEERPDSS